MHWCYQMLYSVMVEEWFTKVITQTPLSLINTVAYAREKKIMTPYLGIDMRNVKCNSSEGAIRMVSDVKHLCDYDWNNVVIGLWFLLLNFSKALSIIYFKCRQECNCHQGILIGLSSASS